jgi:hypothetical protein
MIFLATTAMDTQTTVAVCALGLLSVFFGIFALYTLKLDIKGLVDREEKLNNRIDQLEEELKLQRDTKSKDA